MDLKQYWAAHQPAGLSATRSLRYFQKTFLKYNSIGQKFFFKTL